MEHSELETQNFRASEFRCKCEECNRVVPHQCVPELLTKLQQLRTNLSEPLTLTSAYRCAKHPAEANKRVPGQHNKGTAVDIKINDGRQAHRIMKEAYALDFKCVVLGHGFVHVDMRNGPSTTWTY